MVAQKDAILRPAVLREWESIAVKNVNDFLDEKAQVLKRCDWVIICRTITANKDVSDILNDKAQLLNMWMTSRKDRY